MRAVPVVRLGKGGRAEPSLIPQVKWKRRALPGSTGLRVKEGSPQGRDRALSVYPSCNARRGLDSRQPDPRTAGGETPNKRVRALPFLRAFPRGGQRPFL